MQKISFVKPGDFFLQKFGKCWNVILGQCDVETVLCPGLKVAGFEGGLFQKLFKGYIFFVFLGTHLVDRFLSYLPMKQIWRKSTVCTSGKLFGENWVIAPKLSKTAFGEAKQQK